MNECLAQSLRTWNRTRAIMLLAVIAALLGLGAAVDDLPLFAPVSQLAFPGILWILWIGAGLAADQRDDRTDTWRAQSTRAPTRLAVEGTLGAALPGLLLVAAGVTGSLLGAPEHSGPARYPSLERVVHSYTALETLPWIFAALFALTALGRWRANAEPRAKQSFRARLAVFATVVGVLLLDSLVNTGREVFDPDAPLLWFTLELAPRTWLLGTGAGLAAVALYALTRAEARTEGPPLALLAFIGVLAVSVGGVHPEGGNFYHGAAAATLLASGVTVLAVLLAPRVPPLWHENPIHASAAAAAVLCAIAWWQSTTADGTLLPDANPRSDMLFLVWGCALVIRDAQVFELLRRFSARHERTPQILWLAWIALAWVALPGVGAALDAPPALVAVVGPAWHAVDVHADPVIDPLLVGIALAQAAALALAARLARPRTTTERSPLQP